MLPRLRGQTSVGGHVDGGLAVLPLLAAIILSSQVRHLSAIGRTEGEGRREKEAIVGPVSRVAALAQCGS